MFLRGDPTPLFELDKRAKDLVLKLDDMVNELHSNIDAVIISILNQGTYNFISYIVDVYLCTSSNNTS